MSTSAADVLPPGFGTVNDLPAQLTAGRAQIDPLVTQFMDAVVNDTVPSLGGMQNLIRSLSRAVVHMTSRSLVEIPMYEIKCSTYA